MLQYVRDRLTIKVLLVLAGILLLSFTILCITIISRQNVLLGEMSGLVSSKLKETSVSAQGNFKRLENDVDGSLVTLGNKVSEDLLKVTGAALSEEEANVVRGMEKLLESSASGVASLIASVGSDSIMAKDYEKLRELSRAGARTEEILFILFLGQDDEPLPSYLNRVDDLLVSYLSDFEYDSDQEIDEELQEIIQVMKKAEQDENVLIHRQQIEYFGLKVGTIVIGVSRSSVIAERAAMTARFSTLKESNKAAISKVVQSESAHVIEQIDRSLQRVQQDNTTSLAETEKILTSSSAEVRASTTRVVTSVGVLSCFAMLAIFAFFLKIMVTGPLRQISKGLQDAAEGEGDLTKRLNSPRTDEIGIVAGWFDAFVERINNIIVEIGGNSETVTASSLEVLSASESLKGESSDLSLKADSVAAASEEMNTSMSSVAAASEQAATNISLVAETAAEMKDALEQVVSRCEEATQASHSATTQVQTATTNVTRLGEAAQEISRVTEVITEIADQTNLLALNATIEAARAGEAGKGFAVVAGEIKSLANQTQDATKEIKEKIAGIQDSTESTVKEVDRINNVIGDVDSIVESIAVSMATQAERAAEVALNISQASQGIIEVNENVAQSSQVSAEIAQDIGEVSTISQEMNKRSSSMRTSSENLSQLASELRNMISVFKVLTPQDSLKETTTKPPVTELVPWTEKLSIGLPEIDEQHKQLVRLVNQLHQAMTQKRGASQAGRILDELIDYTTTHFSFEEALFAEHDYPEKEKHINAHRQLVARVESFQRDFKSGKAGLSMELMDFLADWLKSHIMKTDRAYAPFFRELPIRP